MFLSSLKEEEKGFFLKLAYYVARCDNEFLNSEKDIITTYCFEMKIEDNSSDEEYSLEEILNKFDSELSKKVVLLEIMALIYFDSKLHDEEQKVLEVMVKKFDLDRTLIDKYKEWTKSMLTLVSEGKTFFNV